MTKRKEIIEIETDNADKVVLLPHSAFVTRNNKTKKYYTMELDPACDERQLQASIHASRAGFRSGAATGAR